MKLHARTIVVYAYNEYTEFSYMEINAMPNTAALTTRNTAELSTEVGEISGEFSGISLKYLKPTYGVGGQHEKGFDEGTLVLDGKYVVATKKQPAPVIIIGAAQYAKDWMSQAAFAAGLKSQRYPSLAAAAAAGKRIDWVDDPKGGINPTSGRPNRLGPEVTQVYDLRVLVRKPATVTDQTGNEVNADTDFFIRIGEHFYAPALISFEKMAYKPLADVLMQSRVMAAQEQKVPLAQAKLHHWIYTLGTTLLPSKPGRNAALITELRRAQDPVTKRGAVLPEADVKELEDLMSALNNANVASADAPSDDANP